MFLGIFETFFGLLSLYASTTGNYNYHKMMYTNMTDGERPSIISSGYYNEYESSGTSVTFRYDDDSRTYLYNPNAGYSAYSTYRYYDQVGTEGNVIGHTYFSLEQSVDGDMFRVKYDSDFDDIYNLKIMWYITANCTNPNYSLTHDDNINLKYVTPNYSYVSYTNWIALSVLDFFDEYDGILNITIQTTPINDEEWSGTYEDGYEDGYFNGYGQGSIDGYTEGTSEAAAQNSTAITIFSGILNIGLMPINFFLGILNFEVFGINIGGLVAGFLTIAVALIITRIIFSGGNGKGD